MAHEKHHPEEKSELHPRNPHRRRYDFAALIKSSPGLARHVAKTAYGGVSVDFFDPEAVLALNAALLSHFYLVNEWRVPPGYLCPSVPGRADYIHYGADLLAADNRGVLPSGAAIRCLDIGVGAGCVYPMIGVKEYGWSFVGSDIDPASIAWAKKILAANPATGKRVQLRLQPRANQIFRGVIRSPERFDLTICNPPFHASAREARAASARKVSNLKGGRAARPVLNFGGRTTELWTEGGEVGFIGRMIAESVDSGGAILWFTTLVSKASSMRPLSRLLARAGAADVRTVPMSQGSKASRLLAWTFYPPGDRAAWRAERWR